MAFAFLLIREGPGAGATHPIPGTLILGRGATADLTLQDPVVSREHASLRLDGRTVVVEDLDSSNGTFVNGVEIEQATRLESGDTIGVGDTELELRIESGVHEEAVTPTEVRRRPQP